MKFSTLFGIAALARLQCSSAHYIFHTLMAGSINSTAAIRQPVDEYPLKDVTSKNITCNANPYPATATVNVAAGDKIGFVVLNNTIFHQGPAALYLGAPPSGIKVADWDGSGSNWFKFAEWGIIGDGDFGFTDYGASELYSTIPKGTPSGEYLVRIEQLGLHLIDDPEWYVSCAQIKVTGGGTGTPSPKVSIPGYVSPTNPEVTLNIYDPIPTAYTVPGPKLWNGN